VLGLDSIPRSFDRGAIRSIDFDKGSFSAGSSDSIDADLTTLGITAANEDFCASGCKAVGNSATKDASRTNNEGKFAATIKLTHVLLIPSSSPIDDFCYAVTRILPTPAREQRDTAG
jgi:hypothetical protein